MKKPSPRPDLDHRPPGYWPGITLQWWSNLERPAKEGIHHLRRLVSKKCAKMIDTKLCFKPIGLVI